MTDLAHLIAGESLLLTATGLVSYGLYPHDPAIPEGVPCPFCHKEFEILQIASWLRHVVARNACRARAVSLRSLSTQRRRW